MKRRLHLEPSGTLKQSVRKIRTILAMDYTDALLQKRIPHPKDPYRKPHLKPELLKSGKARIRSRYHRIRDGRY
jgi:hypothetical protein